MNTGRQPGSDEAMKRIRLLIADHEEVFREGLARLLREYPHIEVVGLCGEGTEVLAKTGHLKPDVILVSRQIAIGENVIARIREHCPRTKIATIARPEAGSGHCVKALRMGVTACLASTASPADMVKSIDLIASGRIVISPHFAEEFVGHLSRLADRDGHVAQRATKLSGREIEIVGLIVAGASSKTIARRLVISVNTVNVHVKNILRKLELQNRRQLAAHGVALGIGDIGAKLDEVSETVSA